MHRLRSALIAFGNRLGPSGPLDRVSYLLLAGFVIVTLGRALVGLGALVDVDFLTVFLPFKAIYGRSNGDFITLRQDTTDYYLPAIAIIKEAFLAGEFPTWAPYEVGGAPLASLPNHAALSRSRSRTSCCRCGWHLHSSSLANSWWPSSAWSPSSGATA